MLKFCYTIILAAIFFSAAAIAKDLEDAVVAMRAGDFAEAYCIMRPLAEAGDADAQYNIGWMYLNGYGLRTNDTLALQWWEKASDQGNTDASFSIAMLYNLGEGEVTKDTDKAIDYYLIAAKDGQEDAITILQSMMLRGDKTILKRMHSILDEYADLFGVKRQIKSNKLNARSGPSTENKIVAQLVSGQTVLEILKQGVWSQVVILDEPELQQTVWVYNPMLEATPEKESSPSSEENTSVN